MSSYEVRAIRFIQQIFSYIADCHTVRSYRDAVLAFNLKHNRKVICNNGMTRVALITSDYVVKIDYCPENVERWGGGEQEVEFYQMASSEGYGYLFAKITPYHYKGHTFYIMPRVHGIGRKFDDADTYMTEEESDWCWEHDLYDLHNQNYGWKDGHVVIIDYGANGYR
jgi:hypothetical protein